jgi:hypothetical protein
MLAAEANQEYNYAGDSCIARAMSFESDFV